MEIVLTIAGSDPSGGAGIQQDLKTITACGCYGATVITSLTSQNTLGVQSAMAVPASVVTSQLQSVLSDLRPSAVKIGMIPDREVAEAIVRSLSAIDAPIVYDPVMISTSGYLLMAPDAIDYIAQHLFPLCTLITPNLPEAERIDVSSLKAAYLIKGGHADSDMMTDVLHMPDGTTHQYTTPRIRTRNLHGTGCTLSSAIASYLALGHALPQAVAMAKDYITSAIQRSVDIHIGSGNGPLV